MSAIAVSSIVVGSVLAGASVLGAQQAKQGDVPPAPVPTQVIGGRTVFVSNAGEENFTSAFGPVFSGGSDRAYNQFYAAMQQWARYKLAPAPADADLVFEIGFTLGGIGPPELGHLRLAIRDPKTNVVLWGFSEYVQSAMLKGNRDKEFDRSMSAIVDDIKNLAGQSGATAKP
ncbi:MAG: hypothetical protein ABSF54_02555 [Bryobacteraceae bacterium]|jgi:hypothetical protein